MNPLQFYDLESYLLESVRPAFQERGYLSAEEFFSIIMWKANRAKSKVAKGLMARGLSLQEAVRRLTEELHEAPDNQSRFAVLHSWGLRLPMASAVLTILWPEDFSVYDFRVCDQLDKFKYLPDRTKVTSLWEGYCQYMEAVKATAPAHLSLRDKDRFLWGKSVLEQLHSDVAVEFHASP